MPEVLEAELTRRGVGWLVGRRIAAVERSDPLIVGDGVDAVVTGATVVGLARHGKRLTVLTDRGDVAVHFGMTGRWLVDAAGRSPGEERWDRWTLLLDDGRRLRFQDPRRFGRVWLEPDEGLGPDALALSRPELAAALHGRAAPVKAVLLDQRRVAGLGNLLVDEVLWWAGIDPRRPAGSLDDDGVAALQRAIRRRLPVMLRRGGSHTGALSPGVRRAPGPCPRCGGVLTKAAVAGRTTVWCATHQR